MEGANRYTLAASVSETSETEFAVQREIQQSETESAEIESISGLLPNTTYYLYLNACDESQCTEFAPVGSAVTHALAPLLTSAEGKGKEVRLTINGNGNPVGCGFRTTCPTCPRQADPPFHTKLTHPRATPAHFIGSSDFLPVV